MKVFVASATGAIGRPLVFALVAARLEVIGMSSTENGARGCSKRASKVKSQTLWMKTLGDGSVAAGVCAVPGSACAPLISEEQALQTRGPDAVYYAMGLRGASKTKAAAK